MSENGGENFSDLELQSLKARAFNSELKGLIDKVMVPRESADESALMRKYHALFYRIVNDMQHQRKMGAITEAANSQSGSAAVVRLFAHLAITDYAVYNYDVSLKAYVCFLTSDASSLPAMIVPSVFSDNGVDFLRDYLCTDSLYLTGNAALYRMSRHSLDSYPPLPLIAFRTSVSGRERDLLVDFIVNSREYFTYILQSANLLRSPQASGCAGIINSLRISSLFHSTASSVWYFLKGSGVPFEVLSSVKLQLMNLLSDQSHIYLFCGKGLVLYVPRADVAALNTYYLDLRVKSERQFVLSEITTRNEHQLLHLVLTASAG